VGTELWAVGKVTGHTATVGSLKVASIFTVAALYQTCRRTDSVA